MTGLQAEKIFAKIMSDLGKTVVKTSDKEDMELKIDFYVDDVSYDVKTEKRYDRHDVANLRVIWIEARNVRGDNGWLFGKADKIAFLVSNSFWIIDRKKLVDYITKEITDDNVYIRKQYKKWSKRPGRRDAITYIYPKDIEHLIEEKYDLFSDI